eukprot:3505249-Pleurochrysis_carterae.AAC.2
MRRRIRTYIRARPACPQSVANASISRRPFHRWFRQVPVEDVQRSLTLRDGPAVSLPQTEEFEVADLLERIRAFLRVRHVYAKAPFEDFA